ncbi:hypothetical protein ACIA5C_47770 [Actinoplanes sp. NPDC051343]|uniref:hypothetical protein n=1 Tax=Actinoplanes sp. NPDC051343 TaxID=3363906 RepID=UPI00379DDF4D
MEPGYQLQRRVRESATYLAQADGGETAEYLVRVYEMPDGRWRVHLMGLPWDNSHVAENTFATAQQACAAADALYTKGLDGGRWDIRRWGWRRPEPMSHRGAGPQAQDGRPR